MKDNSPLSLEELECARLLMRRLFLRIVSIAVLGGTATLVLSLYGRQIVPPDGLSLAGVGLPGWSVILTVIVLAVEMRMDMGKLRRLLKEPALRLYNVAGVLAEKARVAGFQKTGVWGTFHAADKE